VTLTYQTKYYNKLLIIPEMEQRKKIPPGCCFSFPESRFGPQYHNVALQNYSEEQPLNGMVENSAKD